MPPSLTSKCVPSACGRPLCLPAPTQELRGLQEELEVLRAAKKAKAAQLAALKRQQKDIDGAIHEQSKR